MQPLRIRYAVLCALMQVAVITYGVLFTYKAHRLAVDDGYAELFMTAILREAGFLLLLVPKIVMENSFLALAFSSLSVT